MSGEFLAWRRCDDTGGISELQAIKRAHVLKNQLPRIWAALGIESNHVVAFRQKTFRPATESAKQINREQL